VPSGSQDPGPTTDSIDVERPGPDPPTVGEPPADSVAVDVDTDDVDEVVLRTFWGAVIAVNVAMAAIPLGLLFIYVRGDWELGGLALAVGAVAAVGAVRFYRLFRADRSDGGEAAP
jgi:hypothetical protein